MLIARLTHLPLLILVLPFMGCIKETSLRSLDHEPSVAREETPRPILILVSPTSDLREDGPQVKHDTRPNILVRDLPSLLVKYISASNAFQECRLRLPNEPSDFTRPLRLRLDSSLLHFERKRIPIAIPFPPVEAATVAVVLGSWIVVAAVGAPVVSDSYNWKIRLELLIEPRNETIGSWTFSSKTDYDNYGLPALGGWFYDYHRQTREDLVFLPLQKDLKALTSQLALSMEPGSNVEYWNSLLNQVGQDVVDDRARLIQEIRRLFEEASSLAPDAPELGPLRTRIESLEKENQGD